MSLAYGRRQKALAGLDNVSHRYGNENFEKMTETAKRLLRYAESFGLDVESFQGPKGLVSSIAAFQAFAKKDLLSNEKWNKLCVLPLGNII